jgi:hypothetical protein
MSPEMRTNYARQAQAKSMRPWDMGPTGDWAKFNAFSNGALWGNRTLDAASSLAKLTGPNGDFALTSQAASLQWLLKQNGWGTTLQSFLDHSAQLASQMPANKAKELGLGDVAKYTDEVWNRASELSLDRANLEESIRARGTAEGWNKEQVDNALQNAGLVKVPITLRVSGGVSGEGNIGVVKAGGETGGSAETTINVPWYTPDYRDKLKAFNDQWQRDYGMFNNVMQQQFKMIPDQMQQDMAGYDRFGRPYDVQANFESRYPDVGGSSATRTSMVPTPSDTNQPPPQPAGVEKSGQTPPIAGEEKIQDQGAQQ